MVLTGQIQIAPPRFPLDTPKLVRDATSGELRRFRRRRLVSLAFVDVLLADRSGGFLESFATITL
jgi:hypothetical protein